MERDDLLFKDSLELAQREKSTFILAERYWDLAESYVSLGKRSGEQSDFKRGLECFAKAATFGCRLPHFWIDYGEALTALGSILHDTSLIQQGSELYKKVIVDIDGGFDGCAGMRPEKAYERAWTHLALNAASIVHFTLDEQDFADAVKIFEEAIMAVSHQEELWVASGKLCLRYGWLQKDLSIIEKGLERLTASKIADCDPIFSSALLGEGFLMLGLLIEDLRLLKEGEKRISEALALDKENPALLYSAGFSSLALGLYFLDENMLHKAVEQFERCLIVDHQCIEARYALFEAYTSLGELKGEKNFLRKALGNIQKLCALWPHSALFLEGAGAILLKLQDNDAFCLEEAIEKFKKALTLSQGEPRLKTLFHYGVALDLYGEMMGDEKSIQHAIDCLSDLLERMPGSFHARFQLGIAYMHFGVLKADRILLERALACFEVLLRGDPEEDGVYNQAGYTLLFLSELTGDSQMKVSAELALLQAAKMGNCECFYHLACLYSLQGKYDKSLHFLQRTEGYEKRLNEKWLEGVKKALK